MSCDYEMNPTLNVLDEIYERAGEAQREHWPHTTGHDPNAWHEPIEKIRESSQERIAAACDEIKALLLEKNRKYGDSALNPKRIFSKADAIEQLNVRIDDKLSRIATLDDPNDEDTEADLIGYLILRRVARGA